MNDKLFKSLIKEIKGNISNLTFKNLNKNDIKRNINILYDTHIREKNFNKDTYINLISYLILYRSIL